MGIVYKFEPADWLVLKMLKDSIVYMDTNSTKGDFSIALRKEKNMFKELIDMNKAA